jgi:hypothetical protein
VKRVPAIRRVPRRIAALMLLATWAIGGTWDVSHTAEHAFEHAHSEHHANLHDERQETHEVTLRDGDHGHDHPDENSVLSTAKPRFESLAAVTSAARKPAAPLLVCLPQIDREVSAGASANASGASGPRAPPLA